MFQTQRNVGNLYILEPMLQGSSDHQLIVKSIMNTSSLKRGRGYPCCNFVIDVIYQVKPVLPNNSVVNRGMKKILVFHGTQGHNVDGILKFGFRPSKGFTLFTLIILMIAIVKLCTLFFSTQLKFYFNSN